MRYSSIRNLTFVLIGFGILLTAMVGMAFGQADHGSDVDPLVDEILTGVEERYASSAFSARFSIESTLKAMQVTDTATGRLLVKYPGKMRWEYETPEPMLLISDGHTIWMYSPQDMQVRVGKADEVLGGNQGVNFLSDIRLLRNQFAIEIDPDGSPDTARLKLTPRGESFDIASITITIALETYEVIEVVTTNLNGDIAHVVFHDIAFQQTFPDELFHFEIPEGADVIQF